MTTPSRAERRRAAREAARGTSPGPTPEARPAARDDPASRMGRRVALSLAAVAILWFGSTYVLGSLGLGARWLVLIDLIAGAAFVWILVATWRMSRLGR